MNVSLQAELSVPCPVTTIGDRIQMKYIHRIDTREDGLHENLTVARARL
jgi:hypothetical protein